MTDIPTATLQSWRAQLNDGFNEAVKPRAACRRVRDAIDAVLAVDVPEPPVVEPPSPPVVQTPIVVQAVTTITAEFVNKTIGPNGQGMGLDIRSTNQSTLVQGCKIKTTRYGIFCDGKSLTMLDTDIESGPSGDDYCVRGNVPSVSAKRCWFKNTGTKGVVRLYGANKYFEDCHFEGGKVMAGGGAVNEWDNENPGQWTQVRGTVKCQSFEVYDKQVVVCDGVDFAGTHHIFVDNGGTLTLKNCKNIPPIQRKSIEGTTVNRPSFEPLQRTAAC